LDGGERISGIFLREIFGQGGLIEVNKQETLILFFLFVVLTAERWLLLILGFFFLDNWSLKFFGLPGNINCNICCS